MATRERPMSDEERARKVAEIQRIMRQEANAASNSEESQKKIRAEAHALYGQSNSNAFSVGTVEREHELTRAELAEQIRRDREEIIRLNRRLRELQMRLGFK